MIFGHNKPFLTAIIVPNDTLIHDTHNIFEYNYLFQNIVNEANKRLSQSKKIRKFLLTDQSFNIENGQLTPTLKMKRRVIAAEYKLKLESLYKKSFF